MTPILAMPQKESSSLDKSNEYHSKISDASTIDREDGTSTVASQEVDESTDVEDSASKYGHSENSNDDDDDYSLCWGDESSWDDHQSILEQEYSILEEELLLFSASCSKLGGGFPSLGKERTLVAVPVFRRSSSAGKIDLKDVLVSAGIEEDDGVVHQDGDDSDDSDDSSRSSNNDYEGASESQGLDQQVQQLQASLMSMCKMQGLSRSAKAVAPGLDGDRGSVNKDSGTIDKFAQREVRRPLAIVQTDSHQTTKTSQREDVLKPATVLRSILGYQMRDSFPYEMWGGYFLEIQNKHIRAYTKELELAIRCENYRKLRTMIRSGNTLQSCNQHGESVVHLVCRRASVKLLTFLIKEAGVSLRVRDDYGRSPLHDTCWSYNDRFDIFKKIVDDSPELLFVEDKRGFSPFDYIPKARWSSWNKFLSSNSDFLRKAYHGVDLTDMNDCLPSKTTTTTTVNKKS